MELDDPQLPPHARAWAYIGADQVNSWLERLEQGAVTNPVVELAVTVLHVVEEQARIIAEMSVQINELRAARPGD